MRADILCQHAIGIDARAPRAGMFIRRLPYAAQIAKPLLYEIVMRELFIRSVVNEA